MTPNDERARRIAEEILKTAKENASQLTDLGFEEVYKFYYHDEERGMIRAIVYALQEERERAIEEFKASLHKEFELRRNQAIEECARVAESHFCFNAINGCLFEDPDAGEIGNGNCKRIIAEKIRSLK